TLFYDTFSVPWDLQRTTFAYLEAVEKMEGRNIRQKFLEDFDETGNGIVTYEEFGKKGIFGVYLHIFGRAISEMGTDKYGYLKGPFKASSKLFKFSDEKYNTEGYDTLKEFFLAGTCSAALKISQLDMEVPDPFVPGLTCGKGKWPSFQLARFFQIGVMLYGQNFPFAIKPPCLYSLLMFYADLTQNGGEYAGELLRQPDPEAVNRYMSDVSEGKIKPHDFTFYVPDGFDNLSGNLVPNVEITDDPDRLFTANFNGGKEIWK
ncbi:MAG: hypothetical protein JRF25_10580, partial [Deltaproteobacteria bacterium]|nr:hypothetical protein [Deltaproteobacteria bacterium]